ncbi:hypothetical protein D3C80_1397430 [compost metagenome]
MLLNKGDILLQTLFGLRRRVCGEGEGDIFAQFVGGLGTDPFGHRLEQQSLVLRIRCPGLRRLGIQIAFLHQELSLDIEAVEAIYKITVKRLLVKGGKGCCWYLSVNQLVDVELE